MNGKCFVTASVLTLWSCFQAHAQYVRIAELEIDPAQLEGFKVAITEGVQAAVRSEPGVLALYAVHEKDNPGRVRVFEVYTDAAAYAAHLEMPHFKQFRATTDKMVLSRKLIDAVPLVLAAKPQPARTLPLRKYTHACVQQAPSSHADTCSRPAAAWLRWLQPELASHRRPLSRRHQGAQRCRLHGPVHYHPQKGQRSISPARCVSIRYFRCGIQGAYPQGMSRSNRVPVPPGTRIPSVRP